MNLIKEVMLAVSTQEIRAQLKACPKFMKYGDDGYLDGQIFKDQMEWFVLDQGMSVNAVVKHLKELNGAV